MGRVLQFPPRVGTRQHLLAKRQELQEAWDKAIVEGPVPTEREAQEVADAIQRADDLLNVSEIQWQPFTGSTAS